MNISLNKRNRRLYQNLFNFLSISVLIFVFVYLLYRSLVLSLTHDEAYTYLYVINPQNLRHIYVPNNHLLHSLLLKISTLLFGNSEIVIRIPNLIGMFLYLIGIYKLFKFLFNKTLVFFISVLIFSFNPAVIDFFPLSRGYALALGFMMIGLYFFFKVFFGQKSKRINIFFCSLFLSIAVTAILTFIYVFISAIIILFIMEFHQLIRSKKDEIIKLKIHQKPYYLVKNLMDSLIKPLLPAVLIVGTIFIVFALPLLYFSGALYWGVKDFYRTILSLIKHTLQEYEYTKFNYFILTPLSIFYQILLIITLFVFIVNFINIINSYRITKKFIREYTKYLLISSGLLFFSIGLLYLQYVMQIVINILVWKRVIGNFPVDRTGIYLIPLFLLFLITSWYYNFHNYVIYKRNKNSSNQKNLVKMPSKLKIRFNQSTQLFFIIFISFLLFFSFNTLNLTHTYCSKGNASVKFIAQDLNEINPNGVNKDVYVQTLVEIPLLYYKERYELDWMKTFHYYDPNYDFDYYIIQSFENDIISQRNLKILEYYPLSDIYLCVD